jgi:adenylate kinase
MILLGAPGIGKGTQAELLCEELATCHLSTGDIFRAANSSDGELSPAMQDALGYMKRGDLVPDETVIDLVRERVSCLKCEYGFLLDGFPRTVDQAAALDSLMDEHNLKLDAVLSFNLEMPKVIERLSGRRTCDGCKTTFHVKAKPPKVEGVCDKCGGNLYQREDDSPESIEVRMKAYHESTRPLEEYYDKRGELLRVNADGTPQEVFAKALEILKQAR